MNLDKAGQAALLKLSELDLEIGYLRNEIAKAIDSTELKDLAEKQTALAGELISTRTNLENIQLEIKRSEEDIRLVSERLDRDRARLNSTSSPKDAIGIQSEIDSLLRRKSDLEDIELALMQDIETAELAHNAVTEQREQLQAETEKLRSQIQVRVDELKSQGRKASADREIVLAKIPAEILKRYQALAAKQVAVGQIVDRACTACRMTLTVGGIDALNNLSDDELGACPECQAMIVR